MTNKLALRITAGMLDADNFYIGDVDVHGGVNGNVEIAPNLGTVRFKRCLKASESINAGYGSGIEAGWGIEAGCSISAQWVSKRAAQFPHNGYQRNYAFSQVCVCGAFPSPTNAKCGRRFAGVCWRLERMCRRLNPNDRTVYDVQV